jgi:HEAT repeat protein
MWLTAGAATVCLCTAAVGFWFFRGETTQRGVEASLPAAPRVALPSAVPSNPPATSSKAAASPEVTNAPIQKPLAAQQRADPEAVGRWLAAAKTKLSWSPTLKFDPRLNYMDVQFPEVTHYYSSAYIVKAEVQNDTGFRLQLGETLFVFEVGVADVLFAGGCDQRDGVMDETHVTDLEERYGLDGHDWRSRDGQRPQSPMAGGKINGMSAADDGIFRRITFFDSPYVHTSYDGYGFGAIQDRSRVEIGGAVLMGRNVRREFLDRVLVVSPSIAPDTEQGFPEVRLLSRFSAKPSALADKAKAQKTNPNEEIKAPELGSPVTEVITMDVATLTGMLKDALRTPMERLLAVNWLAELGQPTSAPLLREIFQSNHLPVNQRMAAVWGLARLADRESIPAMRRCLREEQNANPTLSAYCALALAEMQVREAAPDLAAALERRPLVTARLFITAAQKMGDPALGKPLLAILTDDKDKELKEEHGLAAAGAAACSSQEVIKEFERFAQSASKCEGAPLYAITRLAEIDQPEALEALIRLARSNGPAATHAIGCLARWPTTPNQVRFAIERPNPAPPKPKDQPAASPKAFGALVELTQHTNCPTETLQAAVRTLGDTKRPEAGVALGRLLTHSDHRVRQAALQALAELPPEKSPAALATCLQDSDSQVVWAASKLVQKWELRDQSDVLLELLKRPEKARGLGGKQQAAETLGALGVQAAVPELMKLVEDRNDYAAASAAKSLAKLRVPDAVGPIARRLETESRQGVIGLMVQEGPSYLAELGTPEACQAILKYIASLQQTKGSSRMEYAVKALGKCSSKEVVACLTNLLVQDTGYATAAAAIDALAEAKVAAALPDILTVAKREKAYSETVAAAARAVEQFQAKEQVSWLCSLLTHQDTKVRAAAVHALGVLVDPASVEPLIAALASSDARQVAEILGKLKDARALPALRKELRAYQNDWDTRQAVQQAIALIQGG